MNKEQFFEAIGEIDDRILEKFRAMDLRLAQKRAVKRRAWRRLAVAACIALCLAAIVPVGMWAMYILPQLGPQEKPPPIEPPATESIPEQVTDDQTTEEPTTEEQPTDPIVDPPILPEPDFSINLRSIAALTEMREMIECEDEQLLEEYLRSIEGGGAQSRQDLIDFVALTDRMPYAWIVDGEVTWLYHQASTSEDTHEPYEIYSVTVEAENGEWIRYSYRLGQQEVLLCLLEVSEELGDRNVLPATAQSADGRMKVYFETREPHPSGQGDVITWWGLIDDKFCEITYFLDSAEGLVTWELIGSLSVSTLTGVIPDEELEITPMPSIVMTDSKFAWHDTEFGNFLETPEYHVYALGQGAAPILEGYEIDLILKCEPYLDDGAPRTVRATFKEEEYQLSYVCSYPHSIRRQATHCYKGESEIGSYTALIDQETGRCVSFQMEYNQIPNRTSMTESARREFVQNYAEQFAYDPYEYSLGGISSGDEYTTYKVSRVMKYSNSMTSTCDAVYVTLHNESNAVVGIETAFIGSVNKLEEIPQSMADEIYATLEGIAPDMFRPQSRPLFPVVILEDGRLAMDCTLTVEYYDEALQQTATDSISMLIYLTEPIQ